MNSYRGCCEFKNCKCIDYKHTKKNLCDNCNHGKCWHKIIYSSRSQFESTRLPARKPFYKTIRIFIPEAIVLGPVIDCNYCSSIDDLPA